MNTKRAGDNKLALPALGYIKPDDDRGVVGTRSPVSGHGNVLVRSGYGKLLYTCLIQV